MFHRNSTRRSTSGSISRFTLLGFNRTKWEPGSAGAEDPSSSEDFSRGTRSRSSTGSILKCIRCHQIVKSRDKVKFSKLIYHQHCFCCSVCSVVLNPKDYGVEGSKKSTEQSNLYCDDHKRQNHEKDSLDLFELIARTQSTRINEQRCELPGGIQKCQSVSQLTSEFTITSDHDRVAELLQKKGPYPQVIEPMNGGYWVEGFVEKRQSDSDHMLRSAALNPAEWEFLRSDAANFYQTYFLNQEHQNYIAQDELLGPVVVSVKQEVIIPIKQEVADSEKQEANENENKRKIYRIIVRTKAGTLHELFEFEDSSEPSIAGLAKQCNGALGTNRFFPVTSSEASSLIVNFDSKFINNTFKFGVVNQLRGQTHEEDMFANTDMSPAFSEFLEQIGERVPLQGFDKFNGGLDTEKGLTGIESIHTEFEGREIMFHVSTFLPLGQNDSQQIRRKRFIGNDIVLVIFQEENTPFVPNVIASQFLHAHVIIQPIEPCSEHTRYKISIAARTDVPRDFAPILPKSKVLRKEDLRDFLLTKLVNAEYASHLAPQFRDKMERTRRSYLDELYDTLFRGTLESWCGLSGNITEKSVVSTFESFKKMVQKKVTGTNTLNKKSPSVSSEGSKTPVQELKIHRLSSSHKKQHSDIGLSNRSTSWDRHDNLGNRTWTESTSVTSFRSKISYRSDGDNGSLHSNSPKDRNGVSSTTKMNTGRSSSPTSLGSYGAEEEEGFQGDHDSDTGVGSMSPAETPSGTWDMRNHSSTRAPHIQVNGHDCTRCQHSEHDLDSIIQLKKEITELRKSKSQHAQDIMNLRSELHEFERRDKKNRLDLKEKTNLSLKLQHHIDQLKSQNLTYRAELYELRTAMAGISGEEIV